MVICEICGERGSKYVCQKCGRRVCELCFNPYSWVCTECYSKTGLQIAEEHTGIELPVKLFIIGFIAMFIGVILIIIGSLALGANVSGGIVIFPFIPVVFGFGPEATLMAIIAIVIALIVAMIAITKAIRF